MGSFVERCDARDFREPILSLFERNGQPLSCEEFDWYYEPKADATALSWVLCSSARRDITGLCTVISRTFWLGDNPLRVGIIGNLMLDRQSRAIGGLSLVRSVQSLVTTSNSISSLECPCLVQRGHLSC